MNIWMIYLTAVAGAFIYGINNFFKYKKIAQTSFNEEHYITKHPFKSALKKSFSDFFSNAFTVISIIAGVYLIGYIFTTGAVDALPHF